ncbi:uroporphyrinogen-III synthase [Alkalilimnicola sp. S0819]|uniref:uroporphyrinogen-III synthase n=1 Tax=Alkalilimnicola sp. S0819 TaxID=2613922 RepID=UPI0012621DA9|nr:uroporphyrinogen-III synthase [Alkalilimnicola sp. S0819]KAB7622683.1 uroporphyrinogen-III synthase [Alkalilimnicola sp. S0819]MPQ17321.1 uroporphyrinogen-III synthase [Alkalilimnicola sp. S0819]
MSLAGVGVLVTRPAAQAGPLCELVAGAGGEVWALPGIEIAPTPATSELEAALRAAAQADWWFFTSPNAVEHGLRALAERGIQRAEHTRVAAVGPGTARALEAAGVAVDLVPKGEASGAGLLAEPALADLRAQRLLLFRGEGGRRILPEGLATRGERLDIADVYTRMPPRVDPAPVRAALAARRIRVMTLSSGAALDHLLDLLGEAPLQALALVVLSPRLAEAARKRGLRGPIRVSEGTDDAQVLDAIIHLAQAWRR